MEETDVASYFAPKAELSEEVSHGSFLDILCSQVPSAYSVKYNGSL